MTDKPKREGVLGYVNIGRMCEDFPERYVVVQLERTPLPTTLCIEVRIDNRMTRHTLAIKENGDIYCDGRVL